MGSSKKHKKNKSERREKYEGKAGNKSGSVYVSSLL